jgi:acyl carrier protein
MQLKDSNSTLEPSVLETTVETSESAIATIQTWLINQIAKQLSTNAKTIKVDEPLTRYGLDSIDSVTIVGDMEDWLGTELPSTLLWDHPTIAKAANYLVNEVGVSPTATSAPEPTAAPSKETTSASKGWSGLWKKN